MIAQLGEWERELTRGAPSDPTPRRLPDGTDTQRVYLGHAFDIGSLNLCSPE